MGSVEFSISSADAAGMSIDPIQGMTKAHAVALHILGQLGAAPPKVNDRAKRRACSKQQKRTWMVGKLLAMVLADPKINSGPPN